MALTKPRSLFPRVTSSLWRAEIHLGFTTPLFVLAAWQLSNFPFFSPSPNNLRQSSFARARFSIFRMKSKPNLALDSFSIGGRVRSKKHRSRVGPSESTDSSEVDRFLPVGPLSSIGVEEVANWRAKYYLSDDVVIRISGPIDRVSDFEAEEVLVYEGFFESGFRDRVPSQVAKVSETLEISPGQLNPPSWSILIAMQNLGDLEDLTIGITEVLYSYAISPLNGGEQRYHLHTHGRELPVQEIQKKERKHHPDVPCVDSSLGRRTNERVLKLPIEGCQVPFLVSREALERCNIWGKSKPLLLFIGFGGHMSAKKAAPKRAALSDNDDEVHFIKSNKRQATTALASYSKKKFKALGSTPKVSPSSSSDPTTVLSNLNTKVFPLTPVVLPEGDSSASIQFIQIDLLQVTHCDVSVVPLGERMDDHDSLRADLAALTSQLREEKDDFLAKKKEIKALRLKVRNQDEAGMLAASEKVSLREQLERREEEVSDLRCAAETFDVEKTMAVRGAIVVTRWELMREWLNHQTDRWDLEGAMERVFVDDSLLEREQGTSSRVVDSGVKTPRIEPGSCLKRCRSQSGNHLWMLGVAPALEIMQGPEDRLGTQRLHLGPEGWALNPGVPSFIEYGLLESGDRFRSPEVMGIWRFSFRSWDHDWSPEAVWEPEDSSIGPEIVLGTLRKSLTCLEGAGVGVMTQVPGFAAFHFWIIRDYEGPRCALGCIGVLGLARIGGLWRPDLARMPL
ncbi:hypothetical protein DY000_02048809 [Brassica cretica]|uniref:Uncharacterized protein n=1 Tax=Brassica cretica TaxID=69181 RepID=A0ABQ7ESX9_BRACR|nr:hypothetical protein DY000_02048809 [Brassica cretica]